ncbi:hypothetical protein [Anaerohalosphaera lusitana]|uniref:hypothetical protein n=1 Tax=Anaerohalosphaera lusitana TaxID=1936003 RepID=UPI001473F611|nr:hypothetical protein [Anaerohalosphaera lusitana]
MPKILQVEQFDPAQLDDPVAARTRWKMIGKGGFNLRHYHFKDVGTNRMELKPGMLALAFEVVFTWVGALIMIVGDYDFRSLIAIACGFLMGFLFVAAERIYYILWPSVFDKTSGWHYEGRKALHAVATMRDEERAGAVQLSSIHALQMLENRHNWCRQYELNLVLQDGRRVSIGWSRQKDHACKAADKLADFLEVPVWSNISDTVRSMRIAGRAVGSLKRRMGLRKNLKCSNGFEGK